MRPPPKEPPFPLAGPFSLAGWTNEHLPVSQGAIGNREVFKNSDFIFQVIKGPNARNDWHIDPWDEIFFQMQGHIFVYTIEAGKEVRHRVNEGELFFLPKHVWHSPRRPPGSVGLVIERPRVEGEEDGMAWFCESCGNMLHSIFFWCEDIELTLKKHVSEFNASEELRTCRKCGTILPDPTKVAQWQGDSWK